jgi:hypothetical protein
MPLWIWMDDPAYYGFPCYGESTLKAARDCSGIEVSGDDRRSTPDGTARGAGRVHGRDAAGQRSAGAVEDVPLHAHPGPRLRAGQPFRA